ncbi:HET-domain-containing protein, partial [Rhizodiscina lignyota]
MIRLINTETLCLTLFMGEAIPEYAILSHTWEHDGELSFQDMTAIHQNQERPGYAKVFNTCKRARTDGISYVWIDSCCIDKTSSSELSEAINSMYRWYQKACVCYAFLSDFDFESASPETAMPGCRWFTRGWCLQELLAPQNVHFFDVQWRYIGSKADLKVLISKITRIDEQVLVDNSVVGSIPVARRMSWASERKTTREEDIAYCLLGLFDVNMPLIYGEGPKAFLRLQEEIIRNSNDLSIFAFPGPPTSPSLSLHFCDLLALSTSDFMGCGSLSHIGTDVHWNNAFALTNKGL